MPTPDPGYNNYLARSAAQIKAMYAFSKNFSEPFEPKAVLDQMTLISPQNANDLERWFRL